MATETPQTTQTPEDRYVGQLIEAGAAPYQHKPENRESYYVALQTDAGKRITVWGADLERAMNESGAQPGQRIGLAKLGAQPVALAGGKQVKRNQWRVREVPETERAHTPARSDNEPATAPEQAGGADNELEARQALLEAYKGVQEEHSSTARAVLDDLAERHVEERKQESKAIEADKGEWLKGQEAPETAHSSLWAMEKARRLEPMAKRHEDERKAALDEIGPLPSWPDWLREQDSETARRLLDEIEAEQEAGLGNGIEGVGAQSLRPLSLDGIEGHWDAKKEQVAYRRADVPVFTDTGPRIEVECSETQDIEAALRLAEQKFEPGSPLTLTGDDAFKDEAARIAARLGVAIKNPELQAAWEEERNRLGLPLSLDPDISLRNTIRADKEPVTITLAGELARQASNGEHDTVEYTMERADWLAARADLAQADSLTRVALMRAGDHGLDELADHERETLEAAGYLDDEGRLNKRAWNTLAVKEQLLSSEQQPEQTREQEHEQAREIEQAEAEQEQKALRTRNVGEEEQEQEKDRVPGPEQTLEEPEDEIDAPDFGMGR